MKKITIKKILCLIAVSMFWASILCACSTQQPNTESQNSVTTTRRPSMSGVGTQDTTNTSDGDTDTSIDGGVDAADTEMGSTSNVATATNDGRLTENTGGSSENTNGTVTDSTHSASSQQTTVGGHVTSSSKNTDGTRKTTTTVRQTSTSTTKATTKTTTANKTTTTVKHSHQYGKAKTQSQTCETDGYILYRCSCGDEYTEVLKRTGHKWSEWNTIEAPTASKAGVSKRICNNCNSAETKSIPKLSSGVVTEAQMKKIRDGFLRLVNYERKNKGVQELASNSHLNSVAQTRSEEIIDFWSHTRPNGTTFYSLIDRKQYGYITVGENICMTSHLGDGYYTPADAWVGSDAQIEAAYSWIFYCFKNSPGHYANMISENFEDCGIGISYQVHEASGIPLFYVSHVFGAK